MTKKHVANVSYNGIATYINPDKGIVRVTNICTGKTGVAKCNKKDRFDSTIGVGIAWAKYCGVELPKVVEITTAKKLQNGDRFKEEYSDSILKIYRSN